MHACACIPKRKEERENDPDGTSRCPRCHDGSFVLKTRRTERGTRRRRECINKACRECINKACRECINKACRECWITEASHEVCPNTVTSSTHVCHQTHTTLWRYAERWWRWQRAGLEGLVSLKEGYAALYYDN